MGSREIGSDGTFVDPKTEADYQLYRATQPGLTRRAYLDLPHYTTIGGSSGVTNVAAPTQSCLGYIFLALGYLIVYGLFPLSIAFGLSLAFKLNLVSAYFGCLIIEVVALLAIRLLKA